MNEKDNILKKILYGIVEIFSCYFISAQLKYTKSPERSVFFLIIIGDKALGSAKRILI